MIDSSWSSNQPTNQPAYHRGLPSVPETPHLSSTALTEPQTTPLVYLTASYIHSKFILLPVEKANSPGSPHTVQKNMGGLSQSYTCQSYTSDFLTLIFLGH